MPGRFADFLNSLSAETTGDALGAGLGATANLLGALTSDSKYKGGPTGQAVGSGLGTALGTAVGLPMVGNAVGGLIGGLIGGASDRNKQIRDYETVQRRKYAKLNLQDNVNPYGTDQTLYMAKGGLVADERQLVNVELDELLIDPTSLKVVRKYENPNRFKPHSRDIRDEHMGNFTLIEPGLVVIPKKHAKAFERGDSLSRKSLVAQILKEQGPSKRMRTGGMIGGEDPYNPLLTADRTRLLQGRGLVATTPGQSIDWGAAIQPLPTVGLPSNRPIKASNSANKGILGTGLLGQNRASGMLDVPEEAPAVPKQPGPGKNWRLLSAQALNFLPTAVGIGQALGQDPFLRYDENTQYDTAKSYLQGLETTPNIEASKAAIRRRVANSTRHLLNVNSPSTRAELAALTAQTAQAEGDLIQQATNLAQDARNRKRQSLAQLEEAQGTQRLNMRQRFMDELRMDAANRQSLIQAGISEGVTNYGQLVMDQERLRAVNTMTQYYDVDPYQAELLVDQGVFSGLVNEYIQGRLNQGRLVNAQTGTPKRTVVGESETYGPTGVRKSSTRSKRTILE